LQSQLRTDNAAWCNPYGAHNRFSAADIDRARVRETLNVHLQLNERHSDAKRVGFARLENSEFDPSILFSRARDDTIGAFDRIKNSIPALWILLFRPRYKHTRSNRFAIFDGRFDLLA